MSTSLLWNGWPDAKLRGAPGAPTGSPLAKNREYRVFVDLARIRYDLPGVSHLDAAPELGSLLENRADDQGKVTLRVLVLADPRSFEVTRGRDQEFEVDRNAPEIAIPQEGSALAHYRRARLGGFEFRVKTHAAPGPGEIALSIWLDNRPVDEPVLTFCVVDGCDAEGEKRAFAPRLLGPWNSDPDAALHFIEVGPEDGRRIFGVMKLRGQDPLTWEIPAGVAVLRREIATDLGVTSAKVLYPEPDDGTLKRAGRALFFHLFPENTEDPSNDSPAEIAARTFANFMRSARIRGERPTLLVRMIPIDDSQPVYLPFAVMALPEEGMTASPEPAREARHSMPDTTGDEALGATGTPADAQQPPGGTASELLGLTAAVEIPLAKQHAASKTCIRDWKVAAPVEDTSDGPLQSAVQAMGAFNEIAKPVRKLEEFGEKVWEESAGRQPAAYVITSHHDDDTLKFSDKDEITPGWIRGIFPNPSIAILNGCNTAGVGSAGFIRELDDRGVNAIVATTTTVPGKMAGRYLHCLAKQFHVGDPPRTLAAAHAMAIDCLRGETDGNGQPIGSRAALYQLLGDGGVYLCPTRSIEADQTIHSEKDLWK